MNILKNFLEINQKICMSIENILPIAKPDITENYSLIVADFANKKSGQVIVDIGGGRLSPFTKYMNPKIKNKLIVVDENKEELEQNIDADEIFVADVNKMLTLKPGSADLIVSRYVFEHLSNLPNFISGSKKILIKEGYTIHLFSCKFALFAILNQILPKKLTNKLLNSFIPDSKHIHGFKANYDHCYYSTILNFFKNKGFSIEKIYISYYGSRYFSFFLPFYIISVFYEIILQVLSIKNLCAYILIIAKKK